MQKNKDKILKIKNKLSNLKTSDKTGIIVSIVFIFIFLTMIYFALNGYIWCDEAYTLDLISNSYQGIIGITAEDVHPPFYYLMLKLIFDILNFLNINFSQVLVGKLISIIPIALLLIFNFTIIRKKFGWLSAGLFALVLIGMPKMILYSFQIRMYSWSLLFLILTFYYGYEIVESSNPQIKSWIFLIFFSLLGAYTNYFTLINIVIIYILLVAFIIKNKRKNYKEKIKRLILSILTLILLYLPWIFTLSSKSQNGSDLGQISTPFQFLPEALSYKITSQQGLSFDIIPKFIMFIFSPDFHRTTGEFSIVGIILFIAILILLIHFIFKFKEYDNKFIYLGPLVLVGTIILTFIVSFHNFSQRYVFTSLGIFWLSISFLLSKNFSKKYLFIPILTMLLITSALTTYGFIEQQKEHNIVSNEIDVILNEIGTNNLIISTNSHIYVEFSYYLKDNHILYDINHPELDTSNYTYTETIKVLTGWTAPPKSDDPNFIYNKEYILRKIEKTLHKNEKG